MIPPASPVTAPPPIADRKPEVWAAATALEATFLSEMLKSAGFGAARESFGGGAGETQFTGLLTDEYARGLAEAGGIGLAESIYRSLTEAAE